MSRTPHYIKLMNTRRWRTLRMATIAKAKGLCERCLKEGRVSEATEVHHIRPIESVKDPFFMEQLAYDPNNLTALCHYCHMRLHAAMTMQPHCKHRIDPKRLLPFDWEKPKRKGAKSNAPELTKDQAKNAFMRRIRKQNDD